MDTVFEHLTRDLLNERRAERRWRIFFRLSWLAVALALAWVLAQGDDVAPIPGTKRVAYLEENVAAASVSLGDDDLRRLAEAVPRDAVAGDRYGDLSSIDA